jgi:hypothetical protein
MSNLDFCTCGSISIGGGRRSTCNGDCIFAPHMLLATKGSVSSVGPCSETKTVLWDSCLDDCGCLNTTMTFEIESYTSNLKNVSINSAGITFTSNGETSDEYIAEITFIIRCKRLSDRGSLTIVFDNPCTNAAACPIGFVCDKCSGECIPGGIDVELQ